MGKYEQLERHLGQIDSGVRIQMTFDEIAQWVPGGLPSSAFKQTRWWANEASGAQVHSQAWVRSGWTVASVDLRDRIVTFERANGTSVDPHPSVVPPARLPMDAMADRTSGGSANGVTAVHSANGFAGVNGAGSSHGSNGTITLPDAGSPVITSTNVHAIEQMARFLAGDRMSSLVRDLEEELEGADAGSAVAAAAEAGLTTRLLSEAFLLRRHLDRFNDLIHAAAITLALPKILEDGEVVATRPSLDAGNDRPHGFDLETDRRIADFQISIWTGRDAIRQRMVFQDLMQLAMQPAGRRTELYVAGEAPLRFLRESTSPVGKALNLGPITMRQQYVEHFGDLSMPIHVFTNGPAQHVRLIDLSEVLPQVQTALQSA